MTTCPHRTAIHIFLIALVILAIPWTARAVNYGAIRPGETRSGDISSVTQTDTFTFDGVASQGIIITMTRILGNGDICPWIKLYDPDGALEMGDYLYPTAQIWNYQLRKTGMYTILCSDCTQTETGAYALTLTQIPVPIIGTWNPDCGAIVSGQSRQGEITTITSADTFTFDGVASHSVIITMTRIPGVGDICPRIDLYDPEGVMETYAFLYPDAQIENHHLKKTGTYTIVCSAETQDTTGGYMLTLSKIPGAALGWGDLDGGEILPGQTLQGAIGVITEADSFRFTAQSNATVNITMTNTSENTLAPQINLYDPDGYDVARAWLYPSAQISDYKLEKTGTYTIVCSKTGQTTTGTYNLSLNQIPPTDLGLVRPVPADGGLARGNDALSWDATPAATSYDVYLGTREPLPLVAQSITGTSFRPASELSAYSSYLWYVVARRPQGDMRGPMYLFRTGMTRVRLGDYLLGKIALTPEEMSAADVNMDGRVDIADLIAMYLRGY